MFYTYHFRNLIEWHNKDLHSAVTDAFMALTCLPPRVVCFCQTHHTIVTQLLQSSVRLLDCPWLQQQHRGQVETCIKTLAMTGLPVFLPYTDTHTHAYTLFFQQ